MDAECRDRERALKVCMFGSDNQKGPAWFKGRAFSFQPKIAGAGYDKSVAYQTCELFRSCRFLLSVRIHRCCGAFINAAAERRTPRECAQAHEVPSPAFGSQPLDGNRCASPRATLSSRPVGRKTPQWSSEGAAMSRASAMPPRAPLDTRLVL